MKPLAAGLLLTAALAGTPATASDCPDTLDFTVRELGTDRSINLCSEYRGKVVLIVNTASRCLFTSQYEGLETLYGRYRDRGLVVLGFPSNDFAGQEPGTEGEISKFCKLTYGVKFPMFGKTRVRKGNADPLYQQLGTISGEFPGWNFHKYLLDRDGKLVGSYSAFTGPLSNKLVKQIEAVLQTTGTAPARTDQSE